MQLYLSDCLTIIIYVVVPEKNSLDRQTNGPQSDPLMVLFRYRTLKSFSQTDRIQMSSGRFQLKSLISGSNI